jgi:hypothetical protein
VQRGRSVHLGGVHVDAPLEERANARPVALLHGVGKRRAFRGQCRTGQSQDQEKESTDSSAMHVRPPHVT